MPQIVLFDDDNARDWQPFALTGPVGELRFGAYTLRERAERALGGSVVGHLTTPHLEGFSEADTAPVLTEAPKETERDHLFLSSRAVVDGAADEDDGGGTTEDGTFGDRPLLLEIDGEACGWFAPAGTPTPSAEFLADPASHVPTDAERHTLEGTILRHPWELVSKNLERLERDILEAAREQGAETTDRADDGGARVGVVEPGVHVLGDAPLVRGRDVVLEPGVVLDLRGGPIWLDDGAQVHAFTRLEGPAYVGRNTELLGGAFSGISFGPRCKIRGEVEASVIVGYSNKAHDGFLGHAYLGRWVNLGATTTNSDLKNNYGPIRLWTPSGEVETGETKLGCFLGDHVKTAIGTLLNTGTVIGAGANVFGAEAPPRYVLPFAWGTDAPAGIYTLDRFLETAEAVMARRDVELTDGQREVLSRAWQLASEERS